MKRLLLSLLRSLALLVVGAFNAGCGIEHLSGDGWCDHDCGNQVTRTYDLSDFDEIECHSAFRVTVRQGAAYRVTVTVAEHDLDDVRVRREGNQLRFSLEHGLLDGEAQAVVELPQLRHLEAYDASRVELEGISTSGPVRLELRSASKLEGDLTAGDLTLDLEAASHAELSGTVNGLKLDASGISEARLRALSSRRADVDLSGASSATIRVSEWLDVEASGLSVLHYFGDPRLGRIELSGGARLEHEH
jgi:hypothetical protein